MKIISEEITREKIDGMLIVVSASSNRSPNIHFSGEANYTYAGMSTKDMRRLSQEIMKAADKIDSDKDYKNS